MAQFYPLKIKHIVRETPDAVSVSFDVPEEARERFVFVPGQYLTLRAKIADEDLRRTYSICSGIDDGDLRVAIKRVDGGVFSGFANDNLEVGMEIDVMPPLGRFTNAADPAARNDYVAFAAGSGVTPVLSIVKSVLAREPASTFTLFYGNRDRNSVIFREELEDLKDRFIDRFTLVHVLSREAQDVDILHGRIDADRIRKFAENKLFDPRSATKVFLCGPGDMIDDARRVLEDLGVKPDRIRFELFTPADGGAAAKKGVVPPPSEAHSKGVSVEAVMDGVRSTFSMEGADGNVIDAAHRQGIELPYSCKGGMCCTCRCKLVEGKVEMAENYSLEPWELDAGYILSCQARPLTEKVVLDFDDV
ncbi:1,2-phenylacetyl-CoA epoxidase subunit PaaE [Hoeflea sp. CAU 1731]